MTDGPELPQRASWRDALWLGLIHGPAELLPISSSGHVTLIAWLTGMPYSELPSQRRKTIEVALHAGTALALAAAPPTSPVEMPGHLRSAALASATLAPTALIGLLLRKGIRTKLGTPGTVAAGLAAGSAVLVAADCADGKRRATGMGILDGAVIGLAQAAALWPGVSRSAMSIGAARLRGFGAGDSARIARAGIVPASLAAAALEGIDASRDGHLAEDAKAVAVGGVAAFASALAARPLLRRLESGGRLWPWAVLRCVTAGLVMLRIRSNGDDGGQ